MIDEGSERGWAGARKGRSEGQSRREGASKGSRGSKGGSEEGPREEGSKGEDDVKKRTLASIQYTPNNPEPGPRP